MLRGNNSSRQCWTLGQKSFGPTRRLLVSLVLRNPKVNLYSAQFVIAALRSGTQNLYVHLQPIPVHIMTQNGKEIMIVWAILFSAPPEVCIDIKLTTKIWGRENSWVYGSCSGGRMSKDFYRSNQEYSKQCCQPA